MNFDPGTKRKPKFLLLVVLLTLAIVFVLSQWADYPSFLVPNFLGVSIVLNSSDSSLPESLLVPNSSTAQLLLPSSSDDSFLLVPNSSDNSFLLVPNSSNETLYLLMWTPWFGKRLFDGPLTECPDQRCVVVNDRNQSNQSIAVIFHIRDIDWRFLPSYRRPDQYYVFFNWESPTFTGGAFNGGDNDWKKWYFNLTMTYRTDSDAYSPYGAIVPRRSPLRQDLKKLMKKKGRPIAWMVSNCGTPSKREVIVKELQKHIPVDVYGNCGNWKCVRDKKDVDIDTNSCGQIFEEQYKFYLSFENTLCQDYVTEKLFLRLRRYVVPVVLERRNYKNLCPKCKREWFIAVDDFKSTKELAQYLQYLHGNDTAYYEYLSWHEHYETIVHLNNDLGAVSQFHWCQLCRAVAKKEKKPAGNVVRWWENNGEACHSPKYAK